MTNVKLNHLVLLSVNDQEGKDNDSFVMEVNAQATDQLIHTSTEHVIYTDNSPFVEYWEFARSGDIWKLNLIKQATEDASMIEPKIADFAAKNNFFYDPDFGWLMMPNKGVIFGNGSFQYSDVNNHVIGKFKDKIIEIYTFIPKANDNFSLNYVVAQIVLPISYNDILVRRKRSMFNFGPWGLRRIRTESNDFDSKFCLWAHKDDQISSFELLAPDFMEQIYELPFELNIEIVDNFLYFYAKNRNGISYDVMLQILSKAFDSMKM